MIYNSIKSNYYYYYYYIIIIITLSRILDRDW